MTKDYYSWAPRLTLPRPLVIAGLPGAQVSRTTRSVNMLSGLPFLRVDQRVEHVIGKSIELLHWEEGIDGRLEHERALWPALLSKPLSLVVASSRVTMSDPALRKLISEKADVLYLYLPVDEAVARILADHERSKKNHYSLMSESGFDEALLRQKLQEAQAWFDHIPSVLPVSGITYHEAADRVLKHLGFDHRSMSEEE